MTIADRLTLLADSKAAIRDAIEAQGVAVPTSTPLSAYAGLITEIQPNADAQAYFARMGQAPPASLKRAVTRLFNGAENAGIPLNASGPFDAVYLPVHTTADSLLNLVQNAYNLTPTNTPTTTPYRSFQGDGAASYYSTGFNPATSGGKMTQNSACLGRWSLTDSVANSADDLGNGHNRIRGRMASGNAVTRASYGSDRTFAVPDSTGSLMVSRVSSTGFKSFKGGAAVDTFTAASVAPLSQIIDIGRANTNYSSREIAAAWFGAGLTDAQVTAWHGLIVAFVQALDDLYFETLYAAAGSPELAPLAASKGMLLGTAVQSDERMARPGPNETDTLYDFVEDQFPLQVTGVSLLPDHVQPTQGNFQTLDAQQQLARAAAAGKSVRGHVLIYPKRMVGTWWDQALTLENWQSLVDAHMEAIAAIPGVDQVIDWDVVNEVVDGSGYRTDNPFHNLLGDASYIPYLYQKAAALFPGKDLYWCTDQSEQTFDGYARDLKTNMLNAIEAAMTAGAPITGYNMQSHLRFADGFDAPALRSFLTSITGTLGLKLTIGELDARTGVSPFRPLQKPATEYTATEYDAEAADLIRRVLDVALPFVQDSGGNLLVWSASDISHSWELDDEGAPSGERPSPWDANYAKKPQWKAIRNSLLALPDQP